MFWKKSTTTNNRKNGWNTQMNVGECLTIRCYEHLSTWIVKNTGLWFHDFTQIYTDIFLTPSMQEKLVPKSICQNYFHLKFNEQYITDVEYNKLKFLNWPMKKIFGIDYLNKFYEFKRKFHFKCHPYRENPFFFFQNLHHKIQYIYNKYIYTDGTSVVFFTRNCK